MSALEKFVEFLHHKYRSEFFFFSLTVLPAEVNVRVACVGSVTKRVRDNRSDPTIGSIGSYNYRLAGVVLF